MPTLVCETLIPGNAAMVQSHRFLDRSRIMIWRRGVYSWAKTSVSMPPFSTSCGGFRAEKLNEAVERFWAVLV